MKFLSDQSLSSCHVEIFNRQREIDFKIDRNAVAQIVLGVLQNESENAHWVSIHFLSDRAMRQHHHRFFQDSSSTDCMSFPLDEQSNEGLLRHLGDVFVCPLTALRYAKGSEELFWKELTLYIIHGILHLIGYDDVEPSCRSVMRRRERSAVSFLKKQGVFLRGQVRPYKGKIQEEI